MASPLTVTTTSLPTGTVGTAYSTTLAATGGTPTGATGSNAGTITYTWTLTTGSLPASLTLASNGTISGTPTAAATVTGLVFTVSDGNGNTATNATPLTLTINGAGLSTLDWIGIAVIAFIVIIIIIVGTWAATRPSTPAASSAPTVVVPSK